MWTRKNRWIILWVRMFRVRIPIILPIRCLREVIAGARDAVAFFPFIETKIKLSLQLAEGFVGTLKDYGPIDLVDAAVKNKDGNFLFTLRLR